MKQLVILHLAGAAITTAFYAWMTGGDTVYVLAMIALYLWVLGTGAMLIDTWRMIRDDRSKRTMARRRADRPGASGKGKAEINSDEITLIAAGMIQKAALQKLGLWEQDGERWKGDCDETGRND